jgi:tetratricopeptide (TPR) repeat protein
MRRLLLLIVLVFVFLQVAQGQSIYSSQHDASWEFRFNSSRKANHYTNQLLKQLALAHLKVPERTTFNFFFSYGTSVSFQQGNQLDVSLALTPSVSTGDVVVRDFNLQKLLVPASCNLRLSVVNPIKGEVFSSNHEDINLTDLLAGYNLTSFPDSIWVAGCRVEVEFRGFGFDEAGYKRVENELYAIRDYDAAASLADTLEKKIRHSRIRQFTPEEAFRIYVFCNKGVFLLNEALRKKTEIVPGSDPRGLFAKVPVVVFQFNDLVDFFIREGISGPVAGNSYISQAKAFGNALSDAMKLSQRVDYYSSPFYYRLFSNSTTAGQVFQASKMLHLFANKRRVQVVDYKLLSHSIIDEYLHKGELLMAEGRYAEAVDLFTSAVRFCNVNPAIPMQQRLGIALARARSGLIASYVRIVQKALDNNVPSLADKYLTEAMLYAGRYGMTAADSVGFAGLYGVLSGKNLQSGNNHLAKRNYPDALAEFEKAIQIAIQFKLGHVLRQAEDGQNRAVQGIYKGMFDKAVRALKAGSPSLAELLLKEADQFADVYPGFRPDQVSIDSLATGIARVNYNLVLKEAEESLRDFNTEKAVELLLLASDLSRKYPDIYQPVYDSVLKKAGIPKINLLFSDGRLKLWAGEPEAALNLAGEAMQLAIAFGISRSPEVQQQNASILGIADETLCNRVKGELTSMINSAGESYSHNKFEEASMFVLRARELIYAKAACGLNTLELNKLTEKYRNPVRWHEMVKNAEALILAGDYFKGVEMIQQAGALFSAYRLDTLGLANTSLFDIAIASDYLPLIRYATGFYITRGSYEQSLQLLERMRKTGASAADTYALQESLARGLAQRDVAETEMLNLKTMLKVYTGGDKWYRRFAEVYKYHVENR